jgi:hypothetical protein
MKWTKGNLELMEKETIKEMIFEIRGHLIFIEVILICIMLAIFTAAMLIH